MQRALPWRGARCFCLTYRLCTVSTEHAVFGIEKPKDYDQQKADALALKQSLAQRLNDPDDPDDKNTGNGTGNGSPSSATPTKPTEPTRPTSPTSNRPSNAAQTTFKSRLKRFFAVAPKGADTDF